ncbi:hypothetical protein [Rhodoferax mekongensis]|uniref:hypothetical protein n=1 Tax=Rhodoferax mekongensis TaxID=3068341 RepID=UPI0028BD8A42|nr:hypothetical protein [Rhodoferax sp. TBRC 17199]MDT7514684.1 hypothetical protein [Rhodoferax sp. TBRC 17199]
MATVGGRIKELESILGFSSSMVPVFLIGMSEEGEDENALQVIELDGVVWNQLEGEADSAFKERVLSEAMANVKASGASVLPIFLISQEQGQNREKNPIDSAQTPN